MEKLLTYGPQCEFTGENRVILVDRRDTRLYKTASDNALDYIKNVQPIPGYRQVLVLAMSASEFYGANRNGDAFAESPVKVGSSWAVAPGETLKEWYRTFMKGHVFEHHVNKDPLASKGNIIASFYNDTMHRVELLVGVAENKLNNVIQKIDGGLFPAVSMGCRIPYDVCNICGNRAPTRAQYCCHVNNMDPSFGMNRLLSDGRRCFVWNPCPDLFDISFVFKPADKIGYTMLKVAGEDVYSLKSSAELGEIRQSNAVKSAFLQKISDIDKIVSGDVVNPEELTGGWDTSELLPVAQFAQYYGDNLKRNAQACCVHDSELESLGRSGTSVADLFGVFDQKSALPTARDFFSLLCGRSGIEPNPQIANSVGGWVGPVSRIMAGAPDLLDIFLKSLQDSSGSVNIKLIIEKTASFMDSRPLSRDLLIREYGSPDLASITGGRDDMPGAHKDANTVLTYTDPETGRRMVTTRRAAEEADLANLKREVVETGVAAAGLGSAALLLGSGVLGRKTRGLAALPLAGTLWAAPQIWEGRQADSLLTDEGVVVPANTEFARTKSSSQKLSAWPYIVAGMHMNRAHTGVVKIAADTAYETLIRKQANGESVDLGTLVVTGSSACYSRP